ncbi:MAG: MFS transporter [Chloroflexi bacterium]|nr:MFS transporter [Chloroflexota bacterium]
MGRGGEGQRPSYVLLLTTVCLGGVLAPLNSTMLAVALPEIRSAFSVSLAEIGWLVSAYLIAMAVAQPLGGRLGDQLGRARVFRAGLVAFLALSLATALAPSFTVLVLFRTGQALVGAMVIPNGMAMLRESVPVNKLGMSMGLAGSAISFSAAAGPLLGAGLLLAGSWRLLFLVNVPLVGLALASLALLSYPDTGARKKFALDWVGAMAFAALLVSVTVLLNSLSGGQSSYLLGAGSIGLLAFSGLFLHRQLSSSTPIAEWKLFRNRSYAAATTYIMLNNLVMYTTLLSIPFFVKEVQNKGDVATGTLLAAMSLLMVFVAPLSGRISDRLGRRLPAVAGSLVVLAAVLLILVGLDRNVSYGYLAASLAVLGLGVGLGFGAASTAAIEAAPRELAGAAAGTSSMMRYLGSIIGVGILGAVLSSGEAVPGVGLFRLMFAILAVTAALATVAAAFIHRFPPESHGPPPKPVSAGPDLPAGRHGATGVPVSYPKP